MIRPPRPRSTRAPPPGRQSSALHHRNEPHQFLRVHRRREKKPPPIPQHVLEPGVTGGVRRYRRRRRHERGRLRRERQRDERRRCLVTKFTAPILPPPYGQQGVRHAMPPSRRCHLAMPQEALLNGPDLVRIAPGPPVRHVRGRQNFDLGSERMVGHKVGLITDAEIPSDGLRRRDTLMRSPLLN